MQNQTSNQPIYFEGLNMLRAFCALSIVLYHTSLGFQDKMPSTLKIFAHNLTLGVDMFFIISGFIIIYLLLIEKQMTDKIDFIKFYIRRALRIFPLYFLIVGIAYFLYHKTNPEVDFTKYLYFGSNFWMIAQDKWTVGILNPMWSLCIEEHFYLFIPLLIYLTPLDKVKYVLVGVIVGSIAFRLYAFHTIQYNWMTIYCHSLSRCDLMAVGGLIAVYHLNISTAIKRNSTLIYAAFANLVLLMCILDFSDFTTQTFAVFKKYLFVFPMVILFIGIIFGNYESNTFADRLINLLKTNKILNYLGKISFGLYMYHSGVGEIVGKWHFLPHNYIVYAIVVILITVGISSISYEFFEKQILKLKTPFEILKTGQ